MTISNYIEHGVICLGLGLVILLPGCQSPQNGPVAKTHGPLTSFSQEITSPIHEFQVKAGETYTLDINAKNTGTQPWFGGRQATSVDAGHPWLDRNGSAIPIKEIGRFLNVRWSNLGKPFH